jgi:hypothetical protein
MSSQGVLIDVSCAVEVFLATALLQQERPERNDFTIQEIVNRAAQENITGEMRSGVSVHASQHCVANKAPNPAKHRMLFATGRSTRRLLSPGDNVHPGRTGKIFPDAMEIPEKYLKLLDWAREGYERGRNEPDRQTSRVSDGATPEPPTVELLGSRAILHPLLELRLAGEHLANNEDPDDYVRRLREGWE